MTNAETLCVPPSYLIFDIVYHWCEPLVKAWRITSDPCFFNDQLLTSSYDIHDTSQW